MKYRQGACLQQYNQCWAILYVCVLRQETAFIWWHAWPISSSLLLSNSHMHPRKHLKTTRAEWCCFSRIGHSNVVFRNKTRYKQFSALHRNMQTLSSSIRSDHGRFLSQQTQLMVWHAWDLLLTMSKLHVSQFDDHKSKDQTLMSYIRSPWSHIPTVISTVSPQLNAQSSHVC